MKWPPWQRQPRHDWTVEDTGGTQAREKAERDLEEARKQTREFEELARELREIRQRNHLALAFYRAAGGKQ